MSSSKMLCINASCHESGIHELLWKKWIVVVINAERKNICEKSKLTEVSNKKIKVNVMCR